MPEASTSRSPIRAINPGVRIFRSYLPNTKMWSQFEDLTAGADLELIAACEIYRQTGFRRRACPSRQKPGHRASCRSSLISGGVNQRLAPHSDYASDRRKTVPQPFGVLGAMNADIVDEPFRFGRGRLPPSYG